MLAAHNCRQYRFHLLGAFCLLTIFILGGLGHYRLQVSDSHLFLGTSNPGTPAAPETLHRPKVHHPPLTASGSNYGLSHIECRTKFSGLFDDLDRSVALRKKLGNVTLADIDLSWKPYGAVRVMIYNHKVLIIPCLLHLLTRYKS